MKIVVYDINKQVAGYMPGTQVRVQCDCDGVPTTSFWRKRLIDAQTDGCISVHVEKKAKKELK